MSSCVNARGITPAGDICKYVDVSGIGHICWVAPLAEYPPGWIPPGWVPPQLSTPPWLSTPPAEYPPLGWVPPRLSTPPRCGQTENITFSILRMRAVNDEFTVWVQRYNNQYMAWGFPVSQNVKCTEVKKSSFLKQLLLYDIWMNWTKIRLECRKSCSVCKQWQK